MNAFYNEINNGITIFVPDGNQATTYFNLSEFKSLGANFRSSFEKNAFNATLGFSYIGRYQALSNEPDVPDFIYAAELVARTQYRLDPVGISLSAFYKFNGPIKQYQLVENTPQLVGQDGFHTLDININKALGRALRAGLGVRNVFDVTRINATGGGSGAHGGGNGTAPVGFGRSYFLTLNYKLIQ